jgi:hypothetical protein
VEIKPYIFIIEVVLNEIILILLEIDTTLISLEKQFGRFLEKAEIHLE